VELNEGLSFDIAMEKLETIIKQLEQGNVSLEESIKKFEEGISLINYCSKKLDKAEGKIKMLIEGTDEIALEEDFNLGEG
jgi:exodeoxyribonuclease VII small subunit